MPGILMCLLYALGHLICSRYYEVGTSSDHRNLRLVSQSVQSLSLTLCDSMDFSNPGFPFHQQLPEPIQTDVHCIDDAIQPSHPLSAPSPPSFNLSQNQGLFQ